MFKNIMSLLCLLLMSQFVSAQLKTPASSPSSTITQTVGFTEIEISYSRPNKNERAIFGEKGLVPFGQQWRTGANTATKFSFSTDVVLQNQVLSKGEYTIITVPNEEDWQVDFYTYESGNWTTYREQIPVLSLRIDSEKLNSSIETFEISVNNVKMESADLTIKWEHTKVTIPLKVAVHEKVVSSIERIMAGPSAFDYYNAANYLYKTDSEIDNALIYIQKATSSKTQMFFFYRTESLILAKLGRYPEAITSARKSIELSIKSGNEDFVRLSEKSIEEWEKM